MSKTRKIKLIIYSIALTMSVLIGVFAVYAWYIGGIITPSFSITSANVSSKTTLSKGIDFDYDGYLDLYDDNDSTLKADTTYFKRGSMKFQTVQKNSDRGKVNARCDFSMIFDNVMPSYTYTWHVKVENNGDVDAGVSLLISKLVTANDATNNEYLKTFSVQFVAKNDNTPIDDAALSNYSAKAYLGKIFANDNTGDDFVLIHTDSSQVKTGKYREYLLRFQMEPFNVLVDQEIFANNDTDYAKYQALQGVTKDIDTIEILLSSSTRG